jgi:hypothetical protein
MNLWKPDSKTGRFPILRVIWNLIWIVPMYTFGFLFACTVAAQHLSIDTAKDGWKAIL